MSANPRRNDDSEENQNAASQIRKSDAEKVRKDAAKLAKKRNHPEHNNNRDEATYAADHHYMMNFSKGLHHDSNTGLVEEPLKFMKFRAAIDGGEIDAFSDDFHSDQKLESRKWEAPTAGFVFSLQGPDSQAVTMAPAPAFGTNELAYEMAEVYELALLRDIPFKCFSDAQDCEDFESSIQRLNAIDYDLTNDERDYEIGHPSSETYCANRPRTNTDGSLTKQNAFRGSSKGVDIGPYLSQFMLIGNKSLKGTGSAADGLAQYGSLQINQRVPLATPGQDYMTFWDEWLLAQNGGIAADTSTLYEDSTRFITTPRDLATYVHHDALYEAYLNACLIMLADGIPFDPAFDNLSGSGTHSGDQAGGFALWGGPHILTLVTEVATRALKAVRWQKFNTHLRLRPEVLAARIEKSDIVDDAVNLSGDNSFVAMRGKIQQTVDKIIEKNGNDTALLPMAFQEGSPMHPSYGAGHATVAAACVTILKAFFDGNHKLDVTGEGTNTAYVASESGDSLETVTFSGDLTVNGELNKLAANISIGRNMAGVHFYSDYYDSLRMGEAVAIGILEEQALCYPKDEFKLTLETFDGDEITIDKSGVN